MWNLLSSLFHPRQDLDALIGSFHRLHDDLVEHVETTDVEAERLTSEAMQAEQRHTAAANFLKGVKGLLGRE